MDDGGAFDESLMFNEYHQKPAGSPAPHQHQHQPLLAFQQPGDMMGYALPGPDHMQQDMHHHHHHHHQHQQQQQQQLQDMDVHRHHHGGGGGVQDQIQQQDRQIQIGGGDPQDIFQLPVTAAGHVQPTDIVNAANGQKHGNNIKLEMDAAAITGQQSSGMFFFLRDYCREKKSK